MKDLCRRAFAIPAFLVLLMPSSLSAQSISMICENPGREYQVTYKLGSREFKVDPKTSQTRYQVSDVEKAQGKLILTAQAPNGGPIIRVHLKPYNKIEYSVGGKVFQTDGCYLEKHEEEKPVPPVS